MPLIDYILPSDSNTEYKVSIYLLISANKSISTRIISNNINILSPLNVLMTYNSTNALVESVTGIFLFWHNRKSIEFFSGGFHLTIDWHVPVLYYAELLVNMRPSLWCGINGMYYVAIYLIWDTMKKSFNIHLISGIYLSVCDSNATICELAFINLRNCRYSLAHFNLSIY